MYELIHDLKSVSKDIDILIHLKLKLSYYMSVFSSTEISDVYRLSVSSLLGEIDTAISDKEKEIFSGKHKLLKKIWFTTRYARYKVGFSVVDKVFKDKDV